MNDDTKMVGNIVAETDTRVIGEVYEDTWSPKVRVQWEKGQEEMSDKALHAKLQNEGWELRGFGRSGSASKIIEEYSYWICQVCRKRPYYDSKRDEFYCPQCNVL